jgi:cystathionine beta-lyase
MDFDFDRIIDRRGTASTKWTRYGSGILPMWVADMDFAAPPAAAAAMRARLDHEVFGYTVAPDSLRAAIVTTVARDFAWTIREEDIVFLHGVVPGFNMAARALAAPGDGLLLQTPIYHPMLAVPGDCGLRLVEAPLEQAQGRWGFDPGRFAAAACDSRVFLLCNPHNPCGRVFTRAELAQMAEACLAAGTWIVSDEIHADLAFSGHRHVPIASLAPEIAARTITLMSAGKTYNIAGLNLGWAIITDPALRARFDAARGGMVARTTMLSQAATEAVLRDGLDWRGAMLRYVEGNRDHLAEAVRTRLPGISMALPEATYLAWLDCRGIDTGGVLPGAWLRDHARLALNEGLDFGEPGRGFARLNFGCPRAVLEDGLCRIEAALRRA